jgi:DNA gyrase subunit B
MKGESMSQEPVKYEAKHLLVLEGAQAIRKRPEMNIGPTDERGLHRMVLGAAEWLMEAMQLGRASRVEVTLLADCGVRIADDGPSFLFEYRRDIPDSGLEAELTELRAGCGPRGARSLLLSNWATSLAIVNALSTRMVVELRREGRCRIQEYACGVALAESADAGPADDSGTTITFWPDPEMLETTQISFDVVAQRFRDLTCLDRVLDIVLTDERPLPEPRSIRFRSVDGVREMVALPEEQTTALLHPDIISFERVDPRMKGTTEVALRWRASGLEQVRSFANSQPTRDGGQHLLGFHDGVGTAVNAYARRHGHLGATAPDISTDLLCEGLVAVVSVKLEDAELRGWGRTRSILRNATARDCVRDAVAEHLGAWLEEHPYQATAILDRIISEQSAGDC